MTQRPRLLWTDNTAAYIDVKEPGWPIASPSTLPQGEALGRPAHSTEAMMAGAVPPGLLPSMPKLRWVRR